MRVQRLSVGPSPAGGGASVNAVGRKTRIEDTNLAAENYLGLNRAFYRAEPHTYLNGRMAHLVLAMAKPDELQALLDAGVEYGTLTIRPPSGSESPEDSMESTAEEERQHRNFVATESAGLLQHAAETLIRLYLAHSGRPRCPWLELARERDFRGFKQDVAARFGADVVVTDQHRSEVGTVFLGGPAPPPDGPPADEWAEGIENIESWLRHFAALFLDDANLYNAFKHGLAVQAGEASLKIGDEGEIVDMAGPSIEHLEVSDDPRRWQRVIRWIRPERMAGEIFMAYRMIRNLWLVARSYYLPEAPHNVDLSLMRNPPYDEYRRSENAGAGLVVRTMKIPLLYYEDSSANP